MAKTTPALNTHNVFPLPFAASEPRSKVGCRLESVIRRGIDILVAGLGLFCLSPIFLIIAYLIKRDTPGPVFFQGRRAGRHGREFGIHKFRTMYESPESYAGPLLTAQDDDRVTPLGRWLRDTKVNELPQLWNVLVGDMSLVGPRPEDPQIASSWPEAVRQEILSVRPGVTSPASVIYRTEEKMLTGDDLMEDYLKGVLPSKLRLDQLYVRNRTLVTDLDVIFMTLIMLLPRLREKPVAESVLFWGPLTRFATRFLGWFAIDLVVTVLSIGAAGIIWRTARPLNVGVLSFILVALSWALLYSLINRLLGLSEVTWAKASASNAFGLLFSTCLSTGLYLVYDHLLLPAPIFPSGMIMAAGAMAGAGFVAARYRMRLVTGLATRWVGARGHLNTIGERVLIIGAGELGELASWLLHRREFARSFTIAGMLDDNMRKIGLRVADCEVLGTSSELETLINKYDAGLVILAIKKLPDADRQRILVTCETNSVRLVQFADLLEGLQASLINGVLPPSIAEVEFDTWLNELDKSLLNGNVSTAQALVHSMQARRTSRP
jgi:lipopolysaccharide/colanic/teichoic acid biosynthesis glycosyltransferase